MKILVKIPSNRSLLAPRLRHSCQTQLFPRVSAVTGWDIELFLFRISVSQYCVFVIRTTDFFTRVVVGPASLVGGTAAIYTSLLRHPSSTLNQLSFVLMMLLAIQYAIQPRLSRKYISPKIKKQSVALVEEVAKTSFAAAIFFSKPSAEIQSALKGTNINAITDFAKSPSCIRRIDHHKMCFFSPNQI